MHVAQTLLATSDTLPGWEGLPAKLYEDIKRERFVYQSSKTGKVYLFVHTGKSNGHVDCHYLLDESK